MVLPSRALAKRRRQPNRSPSTCHREHRDGPCDHVLLPGLLHFAGTQANAKPGPTETQAPSSGLQHNHGLFQHLLLHLRSFFEAILPRLLQLAVPGPRRPTARDPGRHQHALALLDNEVFRSFRHDCFRFEEKRQTDKCTALVSSHDGADLRLAGAQGRSRLDSGLVLYLYQLFDSHYHVFLLRLGRLWARHEEVSLVEALFDAIAISSIRCFFRLRRLFGEESNRISAHSLLVHVRSESIVFCSLSQLLPQVVQKEGGLIHSLAN